MTGPAKGGPSVTSRVVDLLDAFTVERPLLTLSELSRRSGLPVSTTHRLVAELTGRGILGRDNTGRFHVGLRLWEIGSLAPASHELREAALPYLEDLYETTHENVQLAILDGDEAVYVERLSGRDSVHVVTRAGSRLPVHATGVGLVLLAHAPHEVRERILGTELRRYTKLTITDPRRLRRILADVRLQGFVISDRQIELVSTSVAAPIRGEGGHVVAALSIVISSKHADPRRFVPAVMAAARGVSRKLSRPETAGTPTT
jgi:DNA-binding IclR family transcriptional regulator